MKAMITRICLFTSLKCQWRHGADISSACRWQLLKKNWWWCFMRSHRIKPITIYPLGTLDITVFIQFILQMHTNEMSLDLWIISIQRVSAERTCWSSPCLGVDFTCSGFLGVTTTWQRLCRTVLALFMCVGGVYELVFTSISIVYVFVCPCYRCLQDLCLENRHTSSPKV